MHHDGIHNGVGVDRLQNSGLSCTEHPKELRYETFGLSVIEYRRVVFLVENELEGRVVDQLLNLLDEAVRVGVTHLEAQLQVLVVKNTDVSLRILRKHFDYSCRVHQVLVEEGWQPFRGPEDVLRLSELG